MENPPSPLDTLRQLKEMLDAGALTSSEFEALKQRLVFGSDDAAARIISGPAAPATTPPELPTPVPIPPAATRTMQPGPTPPAPSAEFHSVMADAGASGSQAPAHQATTGKAAESEALLAVPVAPEPVQAYTEPMPAHGADGFPEAQVPLARSPLALILSIGGLLALLALVLYLSLNRQPSEHISSLSQTAADSVAAPIETGSQAERLPAPVAIPETVRLAPAHPAPALPARSNAPVRDSAAAAPGASAPDSAGSH